MLASPFPAPLPLSCHCVKGWLTREGRSWRELPGALNCLLCISQPLWGQLFLSLPSACLQIPSPLLSFPLQPPPNPHPIPVQNCF